MPARRAHPGCSGPWTANATPAASVAATIPRPPARSARLKRRRAHEPRRDGRGDGARAERGQRLQPRGARVGSGPEAVQQRDRPARVRDPVDRPPGAQPEPRPDQAGHDERDQQVERERSEPEPQRPVRRGERDDGVERAQVGERVEHRREDVRGEQHDDEKRQVPVQAVDEEPRQPGGGAPAQRPRDAEDDGRREEDERDRAGAAAQVPERARGGRDDHAASLGQAPTCTTAPVGVDEPRGQAERLEPCRRVRAADDRGGARGVRVHARRRGHAHGAPGRRGRLAGRRVDDVMDDPPAPAPPAHAGARRRQRAAAQRDPLPRRAGPGAVILGDVDRPAAGRDRSGGRDVAAEAHQRRRPRRRRDGGRGAVGREGLRGRAEVEARARVEPQQAVPGVERHGPPPGRRAAADGARRFGAHRREVAVVAERDQRRLDGRVDGAAGPFAPPAAPRRPRPRTAG